MMNLKYQMNEYKKDTRKNEKWLDKNRWVDKQYICISSYIYKYLQIFTCICTHTIVRFISICISKCSFRCVDISTWMYACIPLFFYPCVDISSFSIITHNFVFFWSIYIYIYIFVFEKTFKSVLCQCLFALHAPNICFQILFICTFVTYIFKFLSDISAESIYI